MNWITRTPTHTHTPFVAWVGTLCVYQRAGIVGTTGGQDDILPDNGKASDALSSREML